MSFGSIYLKHVFSRPAWTDLNVDQLKGWHMHMNGMPVSARMRWRLTAAWGGGLLGSLPVARGPLLGSNDGI